MANSDIISRLKSDIISEIINDDKIVNALNSPDSNSKGWEPIFLLNTKETKEKGFIPLVFRELKIPDVVEDVITFITVSVQISKQYERNDVHIVPTLEISVVSHQDNMIVDNVENVVDNRIDYISMLLDEKFNNPKSFGSKLSLVSNVEGIYNSKFLFRKLTFNGLDLSRYFE